MAPMDNYCNSDGRNAAADATVLMLHERCMWPAKCCSILLLQVLHCKCIRWATMRPQSCCACLSAVSGQIEIYALAVLMRGSVDQRCRARRRRRADGLSEHSTFDRHINCRAAGRRRAKKTNKWPLERQQSVSQAGSTEKDGLD